MIKALLIDDERRNTQNLRALLSEHCPGVAVVAEASNAAEGRTALLQHAPDLVFLDIEMPGENGFDFLRSLSRVSFEVIFVTAFEQYGIRAIKFSALDYLLKPVHIEELKTAVEKAAKQIATKTQNLALENLLQSLKSPGRNTTPRIGLPDAKEIRFVDVQDIIRCEAENNYTRFFLTTNEKLLISKPIFEYEELLQDHGFLRCHQSHLVNTAFLVRWIKGDGGSLLLRDGSEVPVSRQKKEWVRSRLMGRV